jgi:hypothetical protein
LSRIDLRIADFNPQEKPAKIRLVYRFLRRAGFLRMGDERRNGSTWTRKRDGQGGRPIPNRSTADF